MLNRRSKSQLLEHEQKIAYASVGPVDGETSRAILSFTQAARVFESSVAAGERRKASTWRWIALFCMVLALMAIGAVLGLTPLKQVEPYLIRVDSNTGFTDIVEPLRNAPNPERVQEEAYVANYIKLRESYSFADQSDRYALVKLMSYDGTFGEYKNFQLSSKGYTEVLADKQQLRVRINNITPMPGIADAKYRTYQVRYTKTPLDAQGQPLQGLEPTTWLVSISFDYKNPPKTREQRWMNPMGFGVAAYSQAQEVRR